MTISLGQYKKAKDAGKSQLNRKSHDVVELNMTKFDPDTGAPKETNEMCSISMLEEQAETMRTQLAELDEFIADLKASVKK